MALAGYAVLLLAMVTVSRSQAISTSMSLPPLQWLNLTGLTTGPAPPPLKDASIGYDDASRTLLVFGGESAGGLAQSSTYLLNLDTLVWTTPSSPDNLGGSPPARSAALSGEDLAASYRRAHVVIGGKNGNTALSDVWEFDYGNQFWAEVNISPGGPSARWGASGGIDTQVAFTGATINNTLYLAGGTNGDGPISISDFWQLSLSGTLSSNLPNSSFGSWQQISTGTAQNLAGQAGTVVEQQVVAFGGCNTTSTTSDSCALQGAYVLSANTKSTTTAASCPAPRLGAALAQNFNEFSTTFGNQVFLLLGTFDTTLWNDGGGLQEGEIDVLDINGGIWSRVTVSGDPGKTGNAAFPSPREGAAALAFTKNLVGTSRSTAADTIVFGGRDASGTYLSELWVLRAYNDAISSSGQKWSGYGGGSLQTGVNANGAGVKVTYMTTCASAILPTGSSSPSSSPQSSSTSPTSTTTPTNTASSGTTRPYDVATSHKVLAPVSIALLLPAVIFLRLALPSIVPSKHNGPALYTAIILIVVAFGAGVAALALSFTSIRSTISVQKRASGNLNLTTGHGKAGLVLFACLYGLVPILFVFRYISHSDNDGREKAQHHRPRVSSVDTAEKIQATSSVGHYNPPPIARRRVHSWGGAIWRTSRTSEDSDSEQSGAMSPRPFQVTNRPQRVRRDHTTSASHQLRPISLGDMSPTERRRSLSPVGELNYSLGPNHQPAGHTTPMTPDVRSTLGLMTPMTEEKSSAEMPHYFDIALHTFFHLVLLAICVFSLVALWSLKSRASFAVFLAWTCLFYGFIVLAAWHGRPRRSLLTVVIFRLCHPLPLDQAPAASLAPAVQNSDQYPFPPQPHSPYVNQQPFRAYAVDDVSTILGSPRSIETEDDDEGDDDDVRQQRMEEEMARRDVSIVTVPRRKLWVTNPESV